MKGCISICSHLSHASHVTCVPPVIATANFQQLISKAFSLSSQSQYNGISIPSMGHSSHRCRNYGCDVAGNAQGPAANVRLAFPLLSMVLAFLTVVYDYNALLGLFAQLCYSLCPAVISCGWSLTWHNCTLFSVCSLSSILLVLSIFSPHLFDYVSCLTYFVSIAPKRVIIEE